MKPEISKEDYSNVLEELKKAGRDKIGVFGDVLGIGIGATGGLAASATVASLAGASTILGSTTLGSLLGGIFVATTPIGWVIGSAAAGGALAYTAAKLIKSGTKEDIKRKMNKEEIEKKIRDMERNSVNTKNEKEKFVLLIDTLLILYYNDKISQEDCSDILKGLEDKTVSIDAVYKLLKEKPIE